MKKGGHIPFFAQEKAWSCTVACLRMVMGYWGASFATEAELYDCCRTTIAGTRADDAVACARAHGLEARHLRQRQLNELRGWLAEGLYPIALINTLPLIGNWSMHAVVVIAVEDDSVRYHDPARGEQIAPLASFEQAWRMNQNRIILITAS